MVCMAACILLYSCSASREANRRAQRDEKNTVKVLYPDYPFDTVLAQKALSYGGSTIEGVAFTRAKSGRGTLAKRLYGANILVTLIPVTPYFEEWYRLRKEKGSKTRIYYMSDQAFRYRLETKTDNYGRFKFEKMKPGKYFLQAFLDWENPVTYNRYVGSGYGTYSTVNYYTPEVYYQQHRDRLEEFVEITRDGAVAEVKLK